jgi:hypothetical protein
MSQRLKQHLLNVHKAISPSSYKQITLNLYKSIRKSKSPVLLRKMVNIRPYLIPGFDRLFTEFTISHDKWHSRLVKCVLGTVLYTKRRKTHPGMVLQCGCH